MGLFGGKNKMSDNEAKARELLDKQLKKELTDAQFLRESSRSFIQHPQAILLKGR